MIRIDLVALTVGAIALIAADPTPSKKNQNTTATITNLGRSIQLAQEGAFVNLSMLSDPADVRRVTRIVSKPVDQTLIGIVVEFKHGDTDDYSYQIIVARAPRSDLQVLRDSHAREIRGKGPRFTKITFDNPVSDDLEVLLESDVKSDKTPLAPVRYTNGCARAWLIL